MRIVRYLSPAGKIGYASEQADGSAFGIRGDIFSEFEVTKEKVLVKKRLAPLVPSMIWCIGLNYKPVPEHPHPIR